MKLLTTAAFSALLVALPCQAITKPYVDPIWRPFILLAGDGDVNAASQRLDRIKQLQTSMVNSTHYDQNTQAFIDGMWSNMERFDLNGFYKLLPESQGRQRSLSVNGAWHDGGYWYSTVSSAEQDDSTPMPLGNSEIYVSASRLETLHSGRRFLLSGKARVGVGASSWQTIRQAGAELINLGSYPPQQSMPIDPETEARLRNSIRHDFPLLGKNDVDFLVPLWSAFPNLTHLLQSVATVEDIVDEQDNNQGYRDYTLSFKLDHDKMKGRYPHLSRYLDRVGDLMTATVNVSNADGRLVQISLDTHDWRIKIKSVLSFGGIVPEKDGKLQLDKVLKFGDKPVNLLVSVNSDLDIFGVKTHVRNLQASLQYAPSPDALRLETNIDTVPQVTVNGAFMNVVPTGLIDMMIPDNIASIVTKFFTVACNGNAGQGITADVELHNTKVPGVIDTRVDGSVLAIDNSFLQLGMRIVNTRMIPDDKASQELRGLFFAMQNAFYQDFDLYMQQRRETVASR